MAKKKEFYYVMVMTVNGPRFVTSIDYMNNTCEWKATEKPLAMSSKDYAQDMIVGLMWNGNNAYVVASRFEIDTQPYRYECGEFEWKSK